MRTIALQISSTDYPRWGARREDYADGSSAAFLCLGPLIIKGSLGRNRKPAPIDCESAWPSDLESGGSAS